MSSVRRVKKGPGRRPQSAKRQRFMELRARGWSILAAAREVGVSRTSGANWARGYKTYRNGEVFGFVAPLDHQVAVLARTVDRSGTTTTVCQSPQGPVTIG